MFKYNVKIQKVSGSLNESVLPNKNLVIKSKTAKSNEQLFAEASEYYKNKYGLVIESADVSGENGAEVDYNFIHDLFSNSANGTVESRLTNRAWQDAIRHYSNYRAAKRYFDKNPNGEMSEDAQREMEISEEKIKKIRMKLQQDLEKYESEGMLKMSTIDAFRKGFDI